MERFAPFGFVSAVVVSPLLVFWCWITGVFEPMRAFAEGALWPALLSAVVLLAVLCVVTVPLAMVTAISSPMMMLSRGGFGKLHARTLLWAMTYSDPVFRHGTAHRRAKTIMRLARWWMRSMPEQQREVFFSLVRVSDCELGELRIIAAEL